jgi:hypothetical protein
MESEIFRGQDLVVSEHMVTTAGIGQESNN